MWLADLLKSQVLYLFSACNKSQLYMWRSQISRVNYFKFISYLSIDLYILCLISNVFELKQAGKQVQNIIVVQSLYIPVYVINMFHN